MSSRGAPIRYLVDGAPDLGLPVTDRGLSYGDGLFETLLVRDGSPCQWARHWARLGQGCSRLGLPLPAESLVKDEILEVLRGSGSGVLRLTVTRGDGGRGYAPPADPRPRRILSLYAMPEHPSAWTARGVAIRLCRTPATQNPALAGLKHLNRLDSVLARAEWSDPGIAEGLMAGPGGDIIGGTMTNLFLWDGAALKTPPIDRCGVAGTVRALAVELAARLGIACVETRLDLTDLLGAKGLFLTNSVVGVWPVRRLDAHDYDPEDLPVDLIRILRQDAETREAGP